jgi:hypothetical protein
MLAKLRNVSQFLGNRDLEVMAWNGFVECQRFGLITGTRLTIPEF